MDEKYYHIEISPLWSLIYDAKEKVSSMMSELSKGEVDFATMVISELMENAIKYGIANMALPHVSVEFTLTDNKITIVVKNGIKNEEHIKDFRRIMDRILTSNSKEELYIQRMQEIMEHPELGGSQLGLYRIASEAHYEMSYTVQNNILEIRAIKTVEINK